MSLKIKFTNPFITLLLPSILIIIADVVSFALPLRGGERNSFKVTLVLSFTVFLNILNDELPGDGQCSPIIRKLHSRICALTASQLASLSIRLCGRNALLYLPGLNGVEHAGVHDPDAAGRRWPPVFLLPVQGVSPKRHRKQGGER